MSKSKDIPRIKNFNESLITLPIFNKETELFEIRHVDQDNNTLDILFSDPDPDELEKQRDSFISTQISSIVSKKGSLKDRKSIKRPNMKIKGKGGKSNDDKERLIIEIMNRKLKGEAVRDIAENVSTEYGLSKATVGLYLDETMDEIRARAADNIEQVFELHVSRYEQLYRWFQANGFVRFAAKVLKAKEALFGVGQDVWGMQMNNIFIAPPLAPVNDFSKLSDSQLIRLKKLIGKTHAANPQEGAKE